MQVAHAAGFGSGSGACLAADFIVVGQGPEFDAIVFGPLGQGFGCQGAVGDHGVAVQVGVEDGGHPGILGAGRLGAV